MKTRETAWRISLAVLLSGALVGFGPRLSGSAGTVRQASQTISFITPPWGLPPDMRALAAFEKKTGITVQIRNVSDVQLQSKVLVATATHQAAADVVYLTGEALSGIVAPGDMQPLDSFVARSPDLNTPDIQQLNFWRYNGSLYGLITYVQLVMLDYDASRYKKAGFNSPPTTWNELHQEALTVKRKGIDQYPIAFSLIDWSWFLMSLSMGDPMFDHKLNPTFTAPNSPGRRALRLLVQLYKEKLISPALLSAAQPHATYWSGIGTFHQSWEGALAVANNPKISTHAPNVQYLLLPDRHYTWNLPSGLGISKYSSHAVAAWEFIKWYMAPAQQKAIYYADGLIPSRTSVQQSLRKAHKIQGFNVISEQSRYIHDLPRSVKWWSAWDTFVSSEMKVAAVGQASPDAAITAIGQKWTSLRSQYGG